MSLLSRLGFNRTRARVAAQAGDGGRTISTSANLEAAMRIGVNGGDAVTPDTSMQVAAVYACVRLISGAVANLPMHVMQRVSDDVRQQATNHELWVLLKKRPNAWQTPSAFKSMMQAHLLLHGNAYAMIVRSGKKIIGLTPLNPASMMVKQENDQSITYRYARSDGRVAVLHQGEVLHLMGLTLDGIQGVSPLTYARKTIGLALAQERHGAATFRNQARPGFVLRHPGKVGPEARTNLKASLDDYRAGGASEGKALILEEGMEAVPLTMTAQDTQWIESRRFSRADIAMFFGVPPHMIGDMEKSTSWGSGIEQQSIGFITYTLESHLTVWEETINRALIAADDIYVRFNRKALVRGDIKTRQQFYTSMLQWGVFSPNEVRAFEDMNPREGGDVFYEPPNAPGGLASEPPEADPDDKGDML